MIYALIIIGIIILGGILWLATIDGNYKVERTIAIEVPVEKAYDLIADFNSWTSWSPWLCMEPDTEVTISPNSNGPGALYEWIGDMTGTGEIEHKSLEPNVSIQQDIRFIKPFKSHSQVYWTFTKTNTGCEVMWGMKGKMPFLFRFMAKKMEPWIGMDYDRGLKMIKDLLQDGKIDSHIKIEGLTSMPSTNYVGVKASCPMNEMETSMKESFTKLMNIAKDNNIPDNFGLSIYHNFDFTSPTCDYSAGLAVNESVTISGEAFKGHLKARKAVKVVFTGDYKHLGNAWATAYGYARYKKLKIKKSQDPVEFYITDPTKESDKSKWVTEVYLPVN